MPSRHDSGNNSNSSSNNNKWWDVDLTSKHANGATRLVLRCMKSFLWKEDWAKRVLTGYRQFLHIKVALEDWDATKLTPSPCIYRMWFQHLLDPVDYAEVCTMLSKGKIIGHNPDSEMDRATRRRSVETTQIALKARFGNSGVAVDPQVWDFENETPQENPKNDTLIKSEHRKKDKISRIPPDRSKSWSPPSGDDSSITFSVKSEKGDEKHYTMKSKCRMRPLFSKYARFKGIEENDFIFIWNGEPIDPDETALGIKLVDGAQISAMAAPSSRHDRKQ